MIWRGGKGEEEEEEEEGVFFGLKGGFLKSKKGPLKGSGPKTSTLGWLQMAAGACTGELP